MIKIKSPKKLIEVALPLDDINEACGREKSIRQGHPSTLHLWWARRPLAAARAILFAQMVVDPSETISGDKRLNDTKIKIVKERERLFDIIRELVKWENTQNVELFAKAHYEIVSSWKYICNQNKAHSKAEIFFNPDQLPEFHDPFAGGGAIPLEAQRLGLTSYASDLNPVAVLINKAMIELPPKYKGLPPIGPQNEHQSQDNLIENWPKATGLAEDVRRYGKWIQAKAQHSLGHLYPEVDITNEICKLRPALRTYQDQALPALVWMWARTIDCPNPACGAEMPLLKSYQLSDKKNKECYLRPNVFEDSGKKRINFEILDGKACLLYTSPSPRDS